MKYWFRPVASVQERPMSTSKDGSLNTHLTGKVAVVIGGAGAIGSAIAAALSREGATVIIADASNATSEVWSRIHTETGGGGRALNVDLTIADEIEAVFAKVHQEFGRLDVLVHAAGIFVRKSLLEMSPQDWDQTQDINMRSFFLCTKAAVKEMMNRGEGRIIGITSGMSVIGAARSSAYSASKAAMVAFMRSVSKELGYKGITINCIGPGITDSPLMRNANTEEEIEESIKRAGRPIGLPEDIVGPVLYLLSDATKSVSGTTLWMKSPV